MTSTIESAQDTEHLLTQGLLAFQKDNFSKALKKFEAYLRKSGPNASVQQAAAYSANKAEHWPAAAKHWRNIHESNTRRLGPALQYVNALLLSQRWESARDFCLTAEIFNSAGSQQHRTKLLVQTYLAMGDVSEAMTATTTSISAGATVSQVLELSETWLLSGFADTAQNLVENIDDLSGDAEKVNWLRGRIAYQQQRWSTATEIAEGFIGTSQSEKALLMLARIANNQQNYDTAKRYYDGLLKSQPDNGEALSFMVSWAVANNDPKAALDLLQEVWDLIPQRNAVTLKARAKHMLNPRDGLPVFEKAVQEQPDNIQLVISYANHLFDIREPDQALGRLNDVLALDLNCFPALRLKVKILADRDAPIDDQLETLNQALIQAPTDVNFLNSKGNLLARRNRADGVAFYMTAIKMAPDAPVLWRNGVYHTLMFNKVAEAHALANKAVKRFMAAGPDRLADVAWIEMAAGRTDRALKAIMRAVANDPSSQRALELAVEISMATGDYQKAWEFAAQFDDLDIVRRPPQIALAAAKCAAAFRTVADAKRGRKTSDPSIAPVRGKFPEKVFDAVVATARAGIPGRSGVINLTSNLGAGGAERQVAYIMQGLGHFPLEGETNILAVTSLNPLNNNDFFLEEVNAAGTEIADLDQPGFRQAVRDLLSRKPECAEHVRILSSLPAELSRVALPFYALLVEQKPRIVHLWQDAINIAGGIAAVLAGVETIVLCTRSTRPVEIRRHRRYIKAGYQALMRYQGRVIVLNNSANGARDYEDWLDLPRGTIRVFYNGYDFATMKQRGMTIADGHIRKELGIPGNAPVIGGVMRFSAEKRPDLWVDTVVAAVGKDPDIHGVIVGDGPMREDLMAKIEDLGLQGRIHCVGRQSPVEPWMNAMDVLFLSSVTEGLPNVLIEAQAMGCPVVTMDVGGAAETILPTITGIALQEAPPDALADDIITLLGDTARRSGMSEQAIAHVEAQFGLIGMISALKDVYGTPHDRPTEPDRDAAC